MRKIILTIQTSLNGVVSDMEKWIILDDEIISEMGFIGEIKL